MTAARTASLPDKTGTLAMLDDVSGVYYEPVTTGPLAAPEFLFDDFGNVIQADGTYRDTTPESTSGLSPREAVSRGAQWYNYGSALVAADANVVDVPVVVNGTITRIRITSEGGTGSCVIDVWRDSYANYPPTVADTIFSGGKPTISSGIKYDDTTLTGVSTSVTAGQHLFFKLESSSVFTRVSIYVEVTPS